MYFEAFPKILHSYIDKNGREVLVLLKDITLNVRMRKEVLKNITLFEEYDLLDGDTPEMVAERFYGSPEYHWVIMLVNEKFDYASDFPLNAEDLFSYCTQKYGTGNEHNTRHWICSKTGYVVNSDFPTAVPVSNFQYEDELNEKKRRIKLIAPQLLSAVIAQFDQLMP
jgi:hypothetical protein